MDLEKLASSPRKNNSSEHLQLLARRAVGRFLSKESDNLTSAVSESIKGEGLNKEQMRRVAEMANQAAWKETFSEDRQVNFAPADQVAVIESFSEKAEEVRPTNSDYMSGPPVEKVEVDLHEAFGIQPDNEAYPDFNPKQEAQEVTEKAASARDLTRHTLDRIERELPERAQDFFHQVKQAHLMEGHALTKIAKAVAEVTDSSFATYSMRAAAEELVQQGIRPSLKKEKLAAAEDLLINTDHDLIRSAVLFEKVAKAVVHARKRHQIAEAAYTNSLNALRG
jgi:hypothetical protein